MIENRLNQEGRKIKCPSCKHEFTTRSKLLLISCANCGKKFREKSGKSDRKES
jgi:ribosomal protein L37AE/L43A